MRRVTLVIILFMLVCCYLSHAAGRSRPVKPGKPGGPWQAWRPWQALDKCPGYCTKRCEKKDKDCKVKDPNNKPGKNCYKKEKSKKKKDLCCRKTQCTTPCVCPQKYEPVCDQDD